VIQLTAGALVVDMTAGLLVCQQATPRSKPAQTNQKRQTGKSCAAPGHVVPASREISACSPRSIDAVA
jgi:hypothetical protein